MLSTIQRLSSLPGVSGREDAVREEILSRARAAADSVETDAPGNVIAFKRGKKPAAQRVVFAAHMDEVGFFISHADESGLLRFKTAGGIDSSVLTGARVLVGEQRLPGAIIARPVHLLSKAEKNIPPEMSGLFIDIGATSPDDAKSMGITPGDDAVFDSEFRLFGDGFIKAKALDDRAGCALLLELMKKDLQYDTHFVFHSLEEEGLRGACGAAHGLRPDIAVIAEATTAADLSIVEQEKKVCSLGAGPVLSFLDGRTLYDRALYEKAARAADEHGIPWQPKSLVAGGNDAGAIQTAGGGARVLAVSLPCRYLHTPSCVMHIGDIENTYRLLDVLCKEFGGMEDA